MSHRLLSLVILAIAACTDGVSPRTQRVSISMAASTGAAAASAPAVAGPARAPIAGNGHTLTLGTMALTIGDLRLERSGHQGVDDHGVGTDDVLFDAGPLTIALPVDGGIVTLSTKALPAGSFSEIEADLRTLRLAGSYDATAFDVVVELSHDMEVALAPALTTDDGAEQNVTVAIDLSACFVDAAGTPVDPRDLRDGGSDARRIFRECVAGRLRAFEDDDRDGHGADDGPNHDAGDDHGSDG